MRHTHPQHTPPNLDDLLNRGYRYALSLAHDHQYAQDLLQEACLKISRKGGPWQLSYLIVVIRHTFYDGVRQTNNFPNEPLDAFDLIGDLDIDLPSFDHDLEAALAQLNPKTREMLYLSVVEDYTAQELATLTNTPRGTILSKLHRAKSLLRQLLNNPARFPSSKRGIE